MVVGRGEHGERLHAPVRRARRVVRLAHAAVVVAVADRQHAVAVADRLVRSTSGGDATRARAPPASRARRRRPARARPRSCPAHAVGEAATERHRAPVGGEPVLELGREPRPARRSARHGARRRDHGRREDQPVGVERERHVVVDVAAAPVGVPALASTERVERASDARTARGRSPRRRVRDPSARGGGRTASCSAPASRSMPRDTSSRGRAAAR